jgi:hypothetical protein
LAAAFAISSHRQQKILCDSEVRKAANKGESQAFSFIDPIALWATWPPENSLHLARLAWPDETFGSSHNEQNKKLEQINTIIGTNPGGTDLWGWFLLIPEIVSVPNPLVKSSSDTPTSIPDNNVIGATSTVSVAEDVTISNLSVTLNISHPRMSDLSATLIGPNGTEVPLASLTAANDINTFDNVSCLGDWRVKVVDSVKKQTGTVNGWTMRIEH